MLAEFLRDDAFFFCAFQALSSGSRSARCGYVARVSVLARRFEFGVFVVSPYIGRLHTSVAVLAICNGVARQVLHPGHFTHTAARVLDKEEQRRESAPLPLLLQFLDQSQHVLVNLVAERGVFGDGVEVPRQFVLSSVKSDSGDGESGSFAPP